jgi:hypothetical protein
LGRKSFALSPLKATLSAFLLVRSRERVRMLKGFGEDELRVSCWSGANGSEFCGKHHQLDPIDIERVFRLRIALRLPATKFSIHDRFIDGRFQTQQGQVSAVDLKLPRVAAHRKTHKDTDN